MKDSNNSTQLKDEKTRTDRPAPENQTGKRPGDARGNEDAQRINQQDMGVDADHKTEDMEQKHRGTFP